MIDMKELEKMGLEAGFTHVALLKSSTIELMPEVREMCEKNTCHMYNKRWSCPPGCGDLEACQKKISQYGEGIIVQTVGQLEDPMDGETMMETEAIHKETFYKFEKCSENAGRRCWPLARGAAPNVRNAPIRMHHAGFRDRHFLLWKPMECW